MKKAVIFGVTGQDGSYLAELLLGKDYQVVGVSRRTSTPNDARIKHLHANPKFKVVHGDVTDAFSVFRIIQDEDPQEVYNLAAQSHVGISFDQPAHTWDATAKGCLNILEAIRDCSKPLDVRFYQASSSEMFGGSYSSKWYADPNAQDTAWCSADTTGNYTEVRYQDENTPFQPNSPYAAAKLAAHNLCRIYRESYGLFACSGILFNHESERRGENFVTRKITRHVAKLAYNKLLRLSGGVAVDQPLHLGNLDACRDWGHAEDYVQAMWCMVNHSKPDDFVISTGETHTVREFLFEAFKHLQIDLTDEAEFKKHIVIDPKFFRPSEVPFLRGDSSKARRELAWMPKVSFEVLVRRMVLSDRGRGGM